MGGIRVRSPGDGSSIGRLGPEQGGEGTRGGGDGAPPAGAVAAWRDGPAYRSEAAAVNGVSAVTVSRLGGSP